MSRFRTFSIFVCALVLLAAVCLAQDPVPAETKVTLELKEVGVRDALDALFKGRGLSYFIEPDADGTISKLSIRSATFTDALNTICRSASLTYRLDNGVYVVSGKPREGNWGKVVNVEFKQTKLGDALDTLLKDSGISYTIDPDVNDLTVSAVLRNVTLEKALREIAKAAGAQYQVQGDIIHISSPFRPSIGPGAPPARIFGTPAPPGEEPVIIQLGHANSGDIAPVLWQMGGPGLYAQAAGPNKLVLQGSKDRIERAMALIKALDTESALARPVRIKLVAKVASADRKSAPMELSTESVGAEGSPMPLNVSSEQTVYYEVEMNVVTKDQVVKQNTPQFDRRPASIFVTLTPSTTSDGRITLLGGGRIDCRLAGTDHKLDSQTISKDFQVAASAKPGEPLVIAAGSVDIGAGKAEFVVTATVTVEEGRVPTPPPAPEGQRPATGPYGGPGPGYGGGYGGYGSYGGYSGVPRPELRPPPQARPVPPPAGPKPPPGAQPPKPPPPGGPPPGGPPPPGPGAPPPPP